jgi:hypothetical protein
MIVLNQQHKNMTFLLLFLTKNRIKTTHFLIELKKRHYYNYSKIIILKKKNKTIPSSTIHNYKKTNKLSKILLLSLFILSIINLFS